MASSDASSLSDQTASWCRRAEDLLRSAPAGWEEPLALVREGISLRRRWDPREPAAPDRRRVLRLLPALQTLCQMRLAEGIGREEPPPGLVKIAMQHIAEDDQYLAELLGSADVAAGSVAHGLESFRDDLHWLGTVVALLDRQQGVDFLGRILLEQETLERELESCGDQPASFSGSQEKTGAQTPEASQTESLRWGAQHLREAALARQVESLLSQPEPQDCEGWYGAWQAASRLASRLEGAPSPAAVPDEGSRGPLPDTPAPSKDSTDRAPQERSETTCRALDEYRLRAVQRWAEAVAALPEARRDEVLRGAVSNLADAAAESMTFLEDLPLARAVRILEVLSEDAATCLETLKRHKTAGLRPARRRIRRGQAAIRGELQDRRLTWRMESLLGRRTVEHLERFMLLLLVLFLVLLVAEAPLVRYEDRHWHPGVYESGRGVVEAVFAWIDLAICLAFLAEFGLKMTLAQGRWLYVRRNWITGLLPAIPFGFLVWSTQRLSVAMVEEAELFVLLRALRYLRLPQMARWLRLARPALRLVRLVGFLIWASDRLVRQLRPLLNRSFVVFERATLEETAVPYRTALAGLRERFHHRAAEVLAGLSRPLRLGLVRGRIEDLTEMLSSPAAAMPILPRPAEEGTSREIPLEEIVARLLTATPAGVSQRVSRSLAQSVARWCRAFDVFALRRLPLVRDLVAAGRLPSPYDTTARAANSIGQLMEHQLERVYWFADLSGIVTAPQLVDSIGEWMVRGLAGPARRFIFWGGLFLVFSYLAGLIPPLEVAAHVVERLVGAPLVVLGILCLLPMFLGMWFRQIAGEASDFYSRVAEAQFITATKRLKHRLAQQHRAFLHDRVIAPEMELAPAAGPTDPGGRDHAEAARATVELLWQDYLDGPPFHRSDTRTTTQLLGNLALVSLRETRLGYGRRQRKRLRRLDLAHTRGSMRGPYLWFHFISRSLTQQTARLLVQYNAFAIPLDRVAAADDVQVRRYAQWLSRRLGKPIEQVAIPPVLAERIAALPPEGPGEPAPTKRNGRVPSFQGTDFTAVHFLSTDPALEAGVRSRYGDVLAGLMRRDRRDNIRRVFRTYPFHRWPKERRSFNPLVFYQRHLAGGWVLLLPLKLLWWLVLLGGRMLRRLVAGVREVLHPNPADLSALAEPDPFAVAVRKIHRMRKPLVMECLRMRAEFDPEYLGAILPDGPRRTHGPSSPPVEEDLAMIGAGPDVKRRFAREAADRGRQAVEFRHWLGRLNLDGFSGESLRAMAIAYTIDHSGVRSRLEATRLLEKVFEEAKDARPPLGRRGLGWLRRLSWRRARFDRLVNRVFQQPAFAAYPAEQREACRGLLRERRKRTGPALRRLAAGGAAGDPVEESRKALAEVGRDPGPWSRQLVALRAVQALSILDLKTYCDLVAELGEYGPCPGERANGILSES